jgi:secreted trypsin-like serine protease
VVGGSDAPAGLYPWIVQFSDRSSGGQICGGSLIAERWVLTAAHCLYRRDGTPRPLNNLFVRHGHLRRNEGDEVAIDEVYPHPSYRTGLMSNDVALLRLDRPIPLGERSRLLLADGRSEGWMAAPGTCAAIAGWGSTLQADPYLIRPPTRVAEVLQHAGVPLKTRAQCERALDEPIDEGMVCAGYPEGRIDSCMGDSGGPLVVQTGLVRRPWLLVGVVSFGEGCAAPGKPGVYSRVAHFRDWIAEIIEKAEPGAFDRRRGS